MGISVKERQGKHRVLFAGIPEVESSVRVVGRFDGGGLKGEDENVLQESHEGKCGKSWQRAIELGEKIKS